MVKAELILAISEVRQILSNESISNKDKTKVRAKITDLEDEIQTIEWGR